MAKPADQIQSVECIEKGGKPPVKDMANSALPKGAVRVAELSEKAKVKASDELDDMWDNVPI